MIIVFMTFTLGGAAMINNFAMGQWNTTSTNSTDETGSTKKHVDEALESLQSNDKDGATMLTEEAQKAL